MSALDDRRAAVLLAVAYAAQRHAWPRRPEVFDQLRAPRTTSGQGLLPLALSGSQLERDLTRLHGADLIESRPVGGGRGRRRWVVSAEGRRAGEQRGLHLPEPYTPD